VQGNEKRDRKGKGSNDFFFLVYSFLHFVIAVDPGQKRLRERNYLYVAVATIRAVILNDCPHRCASDVAPTV